MKRIFSFVCTLAVMLVVICSSAFAQSFPTDKGSKMILGGFAFSNAGGDLYEVDGDRMTSIQVNPSVSYFVIPGLALGGKFLLQYASQGKASMTTWGIGPQVMYFVGGNQPKSTVKGTTYPYLGAAFFYTRSTFKDEDGKDTISGTMISLGGGMLHMLSKTVGLFGEAGYQIDNMKPEDGDSASGNKFNIVAGFTFFLY